MSIPEFRSEMFYGDERAHYKVTLPNGDFLIAPNGKYLDQVLRTNHAILRYSPRQIKITIEMEK